MRRLVAIAIGVTLALAVSCAPAFAATEEVKGKVFTKPEAEDFHMDGGGDGYDFLENPDGSYTEYYLRQAGSFPEITRGNTYSGEAVREADRVAAEEVVDEGTTGQDGSVVVGSDGDNVWAAEQDVSEMRTGVPYATSGEAEIGDDMITEGIADGTLPSEATVAGASAGAVLGTVAGGLAVGVAIGTGIDELMHWPSLLPTESGSKIEPGCFYEDERNCVWSTFIHEYQVRLGGVGPCEYDSWESGGKVRLPETEGEEYCEYPEVLIVGRWEYVNTYDGEKQEEGSCTQYDGNNGLGSDAGGTFAGDFPPGPQCGYELVPEYCFGDSWVRCIQGFSGPGGKTYETPQPSYNFVYRQVYAPLFETMSPDAFPAEGLKEHEHGVETPSSHTISPEAPVKTPVPIPEPNEIPAPQRDHIIKHAHTPQTKKEEDEKIAPVPLIPPIEEGAPLPSPENPVVPEIEPGGEPWTKYKEAVERAGLTPKENVLPEIGIDPAVGPDDVTGADPAPGTSVEPSTTVTVNVNPEDAPIPGEAHTPIGPPTEPGFDLPNLGVLCHGFPFGVPCWLVSTIVAMSTTAKAPDWTIVPEIEVSGHKVHEGKFDFAKLEPIMEIVRPAMIAFTTIGIVLLFYSFAKGGGPPSGGNTDSAPMSEPDDDVYL